MIDYIIFGIIDNGVMLVSALYGVSIEKHFPEKYQTGFLGATVGAGVGNMVSDTLAGFGAMNIPLGLGSGLGCLIALVLIPIYLAFNKQERLEKFD